MELQLCPFQMGLCGPFERVDNIHKPPGNYLRTDFAEAYPVIKKSV
jgi:hypothetical protein